MSSEQEDHQSDGEEEDADDANRRAGHRVGDPDGEDRADDDEEEDGDDEGGEEGDSSAGPVREDVCERSGASSPAGELAASTTTSSTTSSTTTSTSTTGVPDARCPSTATPDPKAAEGSSGGTSMVQPSGNGLFLYLNRRTIRRGLFVDPARDNFNAMTNLYCSMSPAADSLNLSTQTHGAVFNLEYSPDG